MDKLIEVLNSQAAIYAITGVITFLLLRHPMLGFRDFMHARAAEIRAMHPVESSVFDGVATFAGVFDSYLTANGQDVKDLVDPAKRAAAEDHLKNKALATVAAAIATDAISGAAPTPPMPPPADAKVN